MTSSSGYSGSYVKQVEGVGFSLAGKVSKRERARIEAAVEDYIRRNYDVIKSHFAAHPSTSDGSSAVRLCINRANNEVTVVGVSGVADLPAAGASAGRNKSSSRLKRWRSESLQNGKEAASAAAARSNKKTHVTTLTSDCPGVGQGTGESMEAAIEYLMSKDESRHSSEKRLLRSSIPNSSHSISTANNISVAPSRRLSHPSALIKQQKLWKRQQKKLAAGAAATGSAAKTATAAPAAAAGEVPAASVGDAPAAHVKRALVGASYDCVSRGTEFRRLFPSVRGEFFIFYDHGQSHCRKMLNAMGFKERQESEERDVYRNIDQMAILWCSGAISSSKRKTNMGYHIVNRLRFRGLLTNKCSLVRTMAEFELKHPHLVPKGLEASTFLPATIHMNGAEAIDIFHKIRRQGMYLIKPGYSDCGKGIVLHRSDGNLDSLIETLTVNYPNYAHKDLVLQKYIENPLLLGGKKFDLRVFLLVVPNQRKEVGVYAFVHPGYVRLACRNFNLASNDLQLHLTNQAVQYRDKTFRSVKEDTVWSPDTLNQFLNKHRAELNVPCEDWVKRRLFPRVKAILGHVTSIVSSSLCDEPMSYELFGCDFLVDDNFNVWLLEVNSDPSLNKSTKVLSQAVTQVVEEGVALAVEVLQRAVRGMPIKVLATQQDYRKVFSHTNESVLSCVLAESRIVYPQHFARSKSEPREARAAQ